MTPLTNSGAIDRHYWLETLLRIARPPLSAFADGKIGERLPKAQHEDRETYASLELLGRTLVGLAPWLENSDASPNEEALREEMATLARAAVRSALDPDLPNSANFITGAQPLVDAAFLAHAMLRAPRALWEPLDPETKSRMIAGLRMTRRVSPAPNNWLLFSAMVEIFFAKIGEESDRMRIDYALRQHEQWHLGNGAYGDGPHFAWDYYNSFVIQPMLLDITGSLDGTYAKRKESADPLLRRAQAYSAMLEQSISPEGTFPAIGRSITYRMAVFQLPAQLALQDVLPESLPPAQLRSAMTAVMRRLMEAKGTFDANGWLTVGFAGEQPALGEHYIGPASLYLCTAGFLPLGLGPSHAFWSGDFMPWTSMRLYAGEDFVRPSLYAK